MKSKRFSEEQIIGILKQTQAAMKVVDLCRMHGIKGVGVFSGLAKSLYNIIIEEKAYDVKTLGESIFGCHPCFFNLQIDRGNNTSMRQPFSHNPAQPLCHSLLVGISLLLPWLALSANLLHRRISL
jgi:putative transposase